MLHPKPSEFFTTYHYPETILNLANHVAAEREVLIESRQSTAAFITIHADIYLLQPGCQSPPTSSKVGRCSRSKYSLRIAPLRI
jgi:hypothetical protein